MQGNQALLLTYAVLGFATVLFLSDRIRPDLVALLSAITLGVTGVLTSQEVFSGFSRSAVITIMAIFVLAEGLQRTGVTEQVGKLLLRLAGSRKSWLDIIVMLAGAFLSLFMNNIAAASVLLPATSSAARQSGYSLSRLLMPLAFGTLLGGMATLLTTTNIIVSSLLRDRGLAGFGLLDFLPVGIPLIFTGVVYMIIIGRKLLSRGSISPRLSPASEKAGDLAGIYRLDERLIRARLPEGSLLIGKTLNQSELRETHHLNAIAIERNGRMFFTLSPETILQKGDVLLFEGRPDEIAEETVRPELQILTSNGTPSPGFDSPELILVEIVLAPRSSLIGQTLRAAHFREKYGMHVIAIWRAGRPIRTQLSDQPLQFGDALLLHGSRERLPALVADPDLIALTHTLPTYLPVRRKAWLALTIMAATLIIASLGSLPIGEVMMGGAILMALTGVLNMDQAYAAIEWKSVFLVAGILPLGVAMTKTGAASSLGDETIRLIGSYGPLALLAGLIILSALLTQAMNGAAVAAILAPVAIQTAGDLGIDPRSLAMGIALATSMAFITPLGHPVNILMMGPGGYRFKDYIRVGLPLTFLLLIVILLFLPVAWPFYPG